MSVVKLQKEFKLSLKKLNESLQTTEILNWKFEMPARIKLYKQRNSTRLQVRINLKGSKLDESTTVKDGSTKSELKHQISILTRALIKHLEEHENNCNPLCSTTVPVNYRLKSDGKLYVQLSMWGASKATNGKAKTISKSIHPNSTQIELDALSDELTRYWSWRYVNSQKGVNFNELDIPSTPSISPKVVPLKILKSEIREHYKHLPYVRDVVLEAIEKPKSAIEIDIHERIKAICDNSMIEPTLWFYNKKKRNFTLKAVKELNSVTMSRDPIALSFVSKPISIDNEVTLGVSLSDIKAQMNNSTSVLNVISTLAIQHIAAIEIKHNHMERIELERVVHDVTSKLSGDISEVFGGYTVTQCSNMVIALEEAFPDLKSLPPRFDELTECELNTIADLGVKLELIHKIAFAHKIFSSTERYKTFPVKLDDLNKFKQPNPDYYAELLELKQLDQKLRYKQNYEGLFRNVNLTPPNLGEMAMTKCQYCKQPPSVYFEHNKSADTYILSVHCTNGCHDDKAGSFEIEGSETQAHRIAIKWHISNLSYYNPTYFKYHSADYVRASQGDEKSAEHIKALELYLREQNTLFELHEFYGSELASEVIQEGDPEVNVFIPNEQIKRASKINLMWAKMNLDLL